jgi:D-glycero-D-manno-heptose 1,7-bisphosphate phosphatase
VTRLYIFDADGTLRRTTVPDRVCPYGPDQWELLPGVRERLTTIDWTRAALGVASNQDHVGYGHLSEDTARSLLVAMVERATDGRATPFVELCPHVLEVPCDCRKPAPGMLLRLLEKAMTAPADTLFVGNAPCDEEAARRAGIPFAWAWDFFAS